MARKEKTITIKDRDNELTIYIIEMPATRTEAWINRLLCVLASSGIEVPKGANMSGAVSHLSKVGAAALNNLDYEKIRPLYDELMGCCENVLSNGDKVKLTPETVDAVIEDFTTLYKLRMEVLKLHFGFFSSAIPSNWREKLKAIIPPELLNTPT